MKCGIGGVVVFKNVKLLIKICRNTENKHINSTAVRKESESYV